MDGLLHVPRDPARRSEFARSRGESHLDPVQAHGAITADGGGVNGAWGKRISRNEIPSALFGDADKLLLTRA
jgi:hypothetical protein